MAEIISEKMTVAELKGTDAWKNLPKSIKKYQLNTKAKIIAELVKYGAKKSPIGVKKSPSGAKKSPSSEKKSPRTITPGGPSEKEAAEEIKRSMLKTEREISKPQQDIEESKAEIEETEKSAKLLRKASLKLLETERSKSPRKSALTEEKKAEIKRLKGVTDELERVLPGIIEDIKKIKDGIDKRNYSLGKSEGSIEVAKPMFGIFPVLKNIFKISEWEDGVKVATANIKKDKERLEKAEDMYNSARNILNETKCTLRVLEATLV